ncbi:unnamed protein product [Prunus armeniaca]|uniref:Uncharacterized protein n=1 Tax=Prunus armeniaca TaxID=36596 RepID=A0A6J5XET5_PRUAR|nr:unnamed protein product [Prunus armeniaca]
MTLGRHKHYAEILGECNELLQAGICRLAAKAVLIESNSKEIISMLRKKTSVAAEVEGIVHDIHVLKNCLGAYRFSTLDVVVTKVLI